MVLASTVQVRCPSTEKLINLPEVTQDIWTQDKNFSLFEQIQT